MPKENSLDDVNKIIDSIAKREEEKSVFVLSIIAKRIKDISKLNPKSVLSLSQLKRTAEDINLILEKLRKVEQEQIKAIKHAVKKSAEITYNTTRNTLIRAQNAPKLPSLKDNKDITDIIKTAQKEAVKAFKNEYQTQAFMLRDRKNPKILKPTKLSKAYQRAVDEATEIITSAGRRWTEQEKSTNYTQTIRQTVKDLCDSGVRVVVQTDGYAETKKVAYESERLRYHTQRIDTAVRRNILDSVRDVNQRVQNKVGEQIGADGVEITVHRYPAEDHAEVQGHQFSKEEFDKMQNGEDCKDIQGRTYTGFQRPIGMWNCRHFTFSIICGVFPQTYDDKQLKDILAENEKGYNLPNGKHLTMYQCTQKQRTIETAIRYAKEGKITAEKAGDTQLAAEYESKVNKLLAEYKTFSKACGLKPKLDRTYVPNY